jgi:NAD(P)-dependent dehydrogenase (short-subunit alcohol dehydrogenase family)
VAVVLVTGGSSGIGLATVRRLLAAGDEVFSVSRRPSPAPGATSIELDLTEPAAAAAAVARVVDATGRIDALVNNAGRGTLAPVEEVSDAEALAIFETNVFAPLRLARAAIPVMRAHGGGRIVNVTSMNDALPAPYAGHYSSSKAALAGASLVLDAEVRPFGVTVTVVAPGFFLTEMAASLPTYTRDRSSLYWAAFERLAEQSAARLESAGDPDDVAAAIETCIRAEDPPARVVVGADAAAMVELVDRIDTEELAAMLRAYVRELGD